MKKISQIYYVNGKYVLENDAKISVHDIGLLRGFGVFDFLVTYRGKPFLLTEHIDRLFKSASLINLNIGKTKEEIRNIILKTLSRNSWNREKTVRIVVTGGIGNTSTEPSAKATIIVIVEPKHDYPQSYYQSGISTFTFDHIRTLANSKSLDYSNAIKALQVARRSGGVESIYVDKLTNTVSETTTSNLFLVKKGKIFTSSENILNGVTRNLLMKLLKKENPVTQRKVKIPELFSANEIFITASNKEVMPVVKIDNKKIGNGEVGHITKNVMKIFRDFVETGKW